MTVRRLASPANRRPVAALFAALALGAMPAARAAERPLWELGAGVSVLQFPAYRGSEENRLFVLPVPYVVYRGDFLKADRRGLRAAFFDSERAELSLSLAASPPASSEHVDARAGMDDLEPTIELGPSLDLRLARSADERLRLRARLPLRAGLTVSSRPESTGWQFTPQLTLDWKDPGGLDGWTLGLVAGPIFGDRRQHRYFYGVGARDATPQRPAYDAKGGYAGTQFLASMWKRFPRWWAGAFVRYDTLGGAVFRDSPLVTDRHYLAAGVAMTWLIGESARRVEIDDDVDD